MSKLESKQSQNAVLNSPCLAAAILLSVVFSLSSSSLGQTRSWGRNDLGQLGLGNSNTPQSNPVTLSNSADITGVSAGEFYTLFLKADGTLLATGNNQFGQLGIGDQSLHLSPVPVISLSNVVAFSASQLHSLALLTNGTMMAWGRNAEGQLGGGGGGVGQFAVAPTPVINLTNVVAISSGGIYSMALKSDGTVWAWGSNSDGQLGNGTIPNSNPHGTPTQVGASVPGFNNIIAIGAGVNHALALKSDGTVWVWGSNVFGEIGNGTSGGNQLVPVQNSSLFGVSQIVAGWHFSYALKPDGTVFAWGYNVRGNLGNGTITSTGCQCNPSPAQTSIANVVDIKTSNQHTLARKSDGSIWAWGWNQFGQIGDGTILTTGCQCRSAPVQVTAAGVGNSAISAGYYHSFAAVPSVTTPSGSNIILQGDNLSIAFDSVIAAGTTSYTVIDPNSTGLNAGSFTILANSLAYNISTTAAFSGNVKVCLKAPTVFSQATFNSLALLHGEGSNLVNRTLSRNYATREICAQTTSLSPFVLAESPTAASAMITGNVSDTGGAPLGGVLMTLTGGGSQVRRTMTDQSGNYAFVSVDTDNFYTVSPALVNYSFSPASRSFSLLANKTDAVFTAMPEAATANPLDTSEYFVRQQYLDFLDREPDPGGLEYWSDRINQCNGDAACVRQRRIDVSAAFFISQEFQVSGLFVYDLYSATLRRKPAFAEYSSDRHQVVGGANLEAEKAAFATSFVQRAEFVNRYQAHVTAESFVDALFESVQSSGVDLSGERTNLISTYNGAGNSNSNLPAGRAAVVRAIADNAAFKQSQYNQAFVLMEYFGYLRRDAEPSGYSFWLNVLNNGGGESGNYRSMVCAFITSAEYQRRFSAVVSHDNVECGQ